VRVAMWPRIRTGAEVQQVAEFVALGRKNWIDIGSPKAGPRIAAILSVVESCRRLNLRVRDYLSTILPRRADLPIRCLPDLTPAAWLPAPRLCDDCGGATGKRAIRTSEGKVRRRHQPHNRSPLLANKGTFFLAGDRNGATGSSA